MNARMTLLSLVLGALGCGELSNDPLRRGVVIGQVVGTAEKPFVGVLAAGSEDPEVEVGEDGAFRVALLAGRHELFFASRTDARRVAFELVAGDVLDLGAVTLEPGLWVTFVFGVEGGTLEEVEGTPLKELQTTTDELLAGPLARGCYLAVVRPGEEEAVAVDFCAATGGERVIVPD